MNEVQKIKGKWYVVRATQLGSVITYTIQSSPYNSPREAMVALRKIESVRARVLLTPSYCEV